MEWLISLASGAVGGNLAGALFKKISLGPVLNSIVGILGGGAGMQWLSGLFSGGGILSQIGGGAIGGTGLMAIIGIIKKVMIGNSAPK
jgi:hypothetical protein